MDKQSCIGKSLTFVSIFLVLLIFNMPLLVSAQQEADAQMQQAVNDAERDAERNVSPFAWGFGGFACGCIGVGYAFFAVPEIPVGALLGKSAVYVDAYTRVYRQTAKRIRIQASVIGCGVSSAVSSLSYLLILPQLDTSSVYFY